MENLSPNASGPSGLSLQLRLCADGRIRRVEGTALTRMGLQSDAWIGRELDELLGGVCFDQFFTLGSAGCATPILGLELFPPCGAELLAGPCYCESVRAIGVETELNLALLQIKVEIDRGEDGVLRLRG